MKHKILLRARKRFALGDTVLLTALVRDIHLAYPGRYEIMVDTVFTPTWRNNPHVVPLTTAEPYRLVDASYTNGIASSKRGNKHHFLSWFHKDFELKTGIEVPVFKPKGDIHLTAEEEVPAVNGRYWVVISGHKNDMPVKAWGTRNYQAVVDALRPLGVRFVQAGATHHLHDHERLKNVLDGVGATPDVRQLFALIRHSEGVVCGVTGAMHVAACFDKPCVVVAGGREEPWWEAYVNNYYPSAFGEGCEPVAVQHKFLHTISMLDCCKEVGCWKAKLTAKEPGDEKNLCRYVVLDPRPAVPKCMTLIEPDLVAGAVMSYYADKTLPAPSGQEPSWSRRVAVSVRPPEPAATPSRDYGRLGHKLTVCVLCYGDYEWLARRCLNSILATVPAERLDLRVACNSCCRGTLDFVKSLNATKVYEYAENRKKYPVMRDMFWDDDLPLASNYVAWFDDDSFVKDQSWLQRLAESVGKNHDAGCRLYGAEFIHDFARYASNGHRPDSWFKSAEWYAGKPFLSGREARFSAPNGSSIRFVAGGFWAACVESLRAAGVPDRRLLHNGGDITIGEQFRQAGFKTFPFNAGKQFVHSSGAEPRGDSKVGSAKRFPWQAGGELG